MDLKSYLKDRAVFVTGADGFMGSHLVDKLTLEQKRYLESWESGT